MKSALSKSFQAATKTPAPASPEIVSVQTGFVAATLVVAIPATDEIGNALYNLTFLQVFASEKPFEELTGDDLVNLQPAASMPISLGSAGKQVTVDVTGLKPNTDYHFAATVDT